MGRPLFSYSNNLGDKNLLTCSSARIRIPSQWTGNNKLGWEKCHLGKFHLSRHKKIKRKIQSIENLTHELMSINTPKRKDKSSPFAIFSGAYYSSCVWYGENWKICFNITTNQDKDIHTPLLGRLLLLEKKKSGRSNLSRVQLTPRTVLHCLSGLNSYSSLHFILLVGLALYPNRNSKTKDE